MRCTKEAAGSITVFVSLLLSLLLAITVAAVSAAEQQTFETSAALAGEAAAESVFAGFYKPLWERYHVLFMADGERLPELFSEYLEAYGESRSGASQGFVITEKSITVESAITPASASGERLWEEMEEDVVLHGVTELSEKFSFGALLEDAKKTAATVKKLSALGDLVGDVGREASGIRREAQILREKYENLKYYLDTPDWSGETAGAMLADIQNTAAELSGSSRTETENMKERSAALSEKLEEISSEEAESVETPEAEAFLTEELEAVREYGEGGTETSKAEEKAIAIQKFCEGLDGIPSEPGDEETKALFREQVLALDSILPEDEGETTSEGKDRSSAEAGRKLLKAMEKWKNGGILSILVPGSEEVSESSIRGKSLPSSSLSGEKEKSDIGIKEAASGAVYMTKHFGTYGKLKKDTVLSYEREYILNGKKSDRENLTLTAEKLFGVRTGMNLIFLAGNAEKKAEADAMAVSLTAAFANPALTKLTGGLILCAWAMAEAVSDTRSLYEGGSVPLIKTESDWKTSLSSAAELLSETGSGTSKSGNGWDYEKYLEALFAIGDKDAELFRMMDLMEIDLQQADKGFLIENCISEASFLVEFTDGNRDSCQRVVYGYRDR